MLFALLLAAGAAQADCLPAEAGGYGQGFRVTRLPTGAIYTWHCPDGKGWSGQMLAIPAAQKPTWPSDRISRLQELSRLQVLHGYAADAGTFLQREALDQLEETRPRRSP